MSKQAQGYIPSHLWIRHPEGVHNGIAATNYIEWFHPLADQVIETAPFFPELTRKQRVFLGKLLREKTNMRWRKLPPKIFPRIPIGTEVRLPYLLYPVNGKEGSRKRRYPSHVWLRSDTYRPGALLYLQKEAEPGSLIQLVPSETLFHIEIEADCDFATRLLEADPSIWNEIPSHVGTVPGEVKLPYDYIDSELLLERSGYFHWKAAIRHPLLGKSVQGHQV